MEPSIPVYFPALARAWGRTVADLEAYWGELQADRSFLDDLNRKIQGVPEFPGVDAPGWNVCVADAKKKNRWVAITTDGRSNKQPCWVVVAAVRNLDARKD